MTLLSGIILIGGLTAAVAAFAQLARRSARLREELEELRNAKVPAPAKRQADVRPMFGELYETKANPLEALGEWPGVPLAVAAAGLFAIGLFTGRPRQAPYGAADSTVAVELAAARLRYDSLATEVDELSDSVAALQKPTVQLRSAARGAAPAALKRAGTTALARPAAPNAPGIAPLPTLPKVDGGP